MKPTITIQGMEQLGDKIDKLVRAADAQKNESIVLKSAETIRDRIRDKAPVGLTGNLKRSPVAKLMARHGDGPAIAIAGIDRKIAPHAYLVEFGTSHSSAHPFFRPAIDECKSGIMNRIKDEVKKEIEGAV